MKNRNKGIIITCVIILVIGLIALLVGGYFAGWDFKAGLTSPYAITGYILVGLGAIVGFFAFLKNRNNKL